MKIKIIFLSIIVLLLGNTIYMWRRQPSQVQLFQQGNLLDLVRQQYPDAGNVYSLKKLYYNWAVVSVGFTPGGGAEVIAKKEGLSWREIFSGNDLIDCQLVEREMIPLEIYGSCMNYSNSQ